MHTADGTLMTTHCYTLLITYNTLLTASRSWQVSGRGGEDHSRVHQVHGGGEEVSQEGEVGGV